MEVRSHAWFRFELDYQLATLRKPYVVICDGFTSTFGVCLSTQIIIDIPSPKWGAVSVYLPMLHS